MRNIQLLGITLMAVCAFGSLVATSAFALTFETAKWLVKGEEATAGTKTETIGGFLFHNLETGAEILCEGILDGTVGPNGEDSITEVLSQTGIKIPELDQESGTEGPSCVKDEGNETCAGGDIEVWPVGLPFLGVLMLDESKYFDLINNAEYAILCLILGFDILELCVLAPNGLSWSEVTNLATEVEVVGATEPEGTCGGKEEGGTCNEKEEVSEVFTETNLIQTTSGASLQVSE
jgi:hypothetical protein